MSEETPKVEETTTPVTPIEEEEVNPPPAAPVEEKKEEEEEEVTLIEGGSEEGESTLRSRKPMTEEEKRIAEEKKQRRRSSPLYGKEATEMKAHDKVFDRIDRFFDAAAEYLPAPMRNVYHKLDPVFDWILYLFILAFPYMSKAVNYIIKGYMMMPNHTVTMLYGLLVCFMGAHFCCLVAVVEAFKLSGAGKKMRGFFHDIWESFKRASEANKADNQVDADGDGIADVDQISDGALFIRKVKLVMREIDPLVLNKALTGLYQGVLSAICVVQFKFAKTITLGNSIGEFLYITVDGLTRPFFEYLLADYAKWVSLSIKYFCKAAGSSIAWLAQFYASLVHCAISGALTFSRALIAFLNERGITNIDTDESWIDEITGWILAVVSIALQAIFGTNLIFPFNIILIPFRGIEAFLKVSASSDAFGTSKNTGAAADAGVPMGGVSA